MENMNIYKYLKMKYIEINGKYINIPANASWITLL